MRKGRSGTGDFRGSATVYVSSQADNASASEALKEEKLKAGSALSALTRRVLPDHQPERSPEVEPTHPRRYVGRNTIMRAVAPPAGEN